MSAAYRMHTTIDTFSGGMMGHPASCMLKGGLIRFELNNPGDARSKPVPVRVDPADMDDMPVAIVFR